MLPSWTLQFGYVRLRPWDLGTTSWLGVYLLREGSYTEAIDYFSLSSLLRPKELKWKQLQAYCMRKAGLLPDALRLYEELHALNPEDANVTRELNKTKAKLGMLKDRSL